jgi:NADPH:quinone reductase-like Zn-dependent oxidoreductase
MGPQQENYTKESLGTASSEQSGSLPGEMKQWETSKDGIENMKLVSAALPTPGPNQVLVKINVVSINYRDTEVIMGLYNHNNQTMGELVPALVPCSDSCGTIVSSKSPLWKAGDKVVSIFNQAHQKGQIQLEDMKYGMGSPLPGVLTEYVVFPDTAIVRKPDYMSDQEAATLPIAAITAWMSINWMRPLGQAGGKGETVLIQGTGGVAICGLQIAKASGAKGLLDP